MMLALLDSVPFWLILPGTLVLILLCMEWGFRFGRWRRLHHADEKDGPVGAMVGAMVALLGFMLAFTFGLAASRYETRRNILQQEANAVGTCFLRAGMLAEPQAIAVQSLLRTYLDVRQKSLQTGQLVEGIKRSEQIHRQLWQQAELAVKADPQMVPTGLFVQSLNEVIDVHTLRLGAGIYARIPGVVWIALIGLTIVSMGGVGYQIGLCERARSIAGGGLALAFSVVIMLVADLDRPTEGILQTNRWALEDARRSMDPPTDEPVSGDRS